MIDPKNSRLAEAMSRLTENAINMPDWTDHNVHDPGVTLLDLMTWLGGGLLVGLGVYAYLRRPRRWPR